MNRKKRRRRSLMPVFIIIVAAIIVIIAVIGGRSVMQVNKLTKETEKIVAMDINTDEVDMNIYSDGEFKVVEKTIKDYVSGYIALIRRFTDFNNDGILPNILTIENIAGDAPEFLMTTTYIENKKQNLAEIAEQLKNFSKEETVVSAIDSYDINKYYKDMYRKQMLETLTLDFFYPDSEIDAVYNELLQQIEQREKVIAYLKETSASWTITEDNAIAFTDESLLKGYQELLAEVK